MRGGGPGFSRRLRLIVPGQVVFIAKEIVRCGKEKILLAVLFLLRAWSEATGRVASAWDVSDLQCLQPEKVAGPEEVVRDLLLHLGISGQESMISCYNAQAD